MKRPDRLAIAAATGKLRAIEREETAVGREQHQLVGGFGMQPEALAVALAIFDRVARLLMSLERAQPALLEQTTVIGSRSTIVFHGFDFRRDIRRVLANSVRRFPSAVFSPNFASIGLRFRRDQLLGLELVGAEQLLQLLLFFRQSSLLLPDLHLFQLAQATAAAC